jgi:hypothetical protein
MKLMRAVGRMWTQISINRERQPGMQSVKYQLGAYKNPASYFEDVYQIFQYGEHADSESNSYFFNIDGQTIWIRSESRSGYLRILCDKPG